MVCIRRWPEIWIAVCLENAVQRLIYKNCNKTHREIYHEISIGSTTVDNILHQQLGVRQLLTEEQNSALLILFFNLLNRYLALLLKMYQGFIIMNPKLHTQQSTIWLFANEDKSSEVMREKSKKYLPFSSDYSGSNKVR